MVLLDSNLFTLIFERRPKEPNVVDLVPFTSQAEPHTSATSSNAASTSVRGPSPLYTYSRAMTGHYNAQLTDSLTGIVLASIDCPTSVDKAKTIHLFNPDTSVLLDKKGNTFRQEWRWTWQGNEFSVRRDGRSYIVEASRKPDPEIDVARYTAASSSKIRKPMLQLLDYNVQRLEIDDRRGLEILAIVVCMHCIDIEYDERHRDSSNIYTNAAQPWSKVSSVQSQIGTSASTMTDAQPDVRNSDLEVNEMMIDLHVADASYVDHAIRLLRQDDGGEGLQMVIVRADMAATTLRAVRIAASIKARWYKLPPMAKGRTLDPMPGSKTEIAEELYQYVRDPTTSHVDITAGAASQHRRKSSDATVGPRGRIKLDSPSGTPSSAGDASSGSVKRKDKTPFSVQSPPERLIIYLSKDRIDEFERVGQAVMSDPYAHHRQGNYSYSSIPSPAASPSPRPPVIPPKTQLAHSDVSGVLKKFKKFKLKS